MKNRLSCVLLLCVLFFSCVQKKDNAFVENVDLDSLMSNKRDSSFIQQVQYLPLESNENSMIARLDVIKKEGDKIFILDKTLGTVFIFNDKGDFVSKINRKGKGPGEYLYLKDFFVVNNTIHLLDSNGLFHIYDMDGKFLNDIKLPFRANYCEYLEDSTIVFQEIWVKGKLEYSVGLYSIEEQRLIDTLKTVPGVNDKMEEFHKFLCKSKNKVNYYSTTDNNIYQITSKGIRPAIVLKSNALPTLDELKLYAEDPDKRDFAEISNLWGIFENEDCLTFSFFSILPYQVIYSKSDNKYSCHLKVSFTSKLGHEFVGVDDDCFVSYIIPANSDGAAFFELLQSDKNIQIIGNHKEQLEKLKTEANPIVVLANISAN